MHKQNKEKIVGFQSLSCKNPDCKSLLKTIYYSETYEQTAHCEHSIFLRRDNGTSYYVCPQCNSKNYVSFQGEKIVLEKIAYYKRHETG